VERAKKVLKTGNRELINAVKDAKVSVHEAATVADLPEEERDATAKAGPKAIKDKAREITGAKKAQQATKARKAAAAQPGAADGIEDVAAAYVAEHKTFRKAIRVLLPRLRAQMRCDWLVPEDQHQRLGREAGRLLDAIDSTVVCLSRLKRMLENKLIEIKKLAEKM
jgi:hypothetical protein